MSQKLPYTTPVKSRASRPPLYELLARAMTGAKVDFRDYPVDDVVTLAERHGAAPLLAHRVHEGSATGLDEAAIQRLQDYARSRGLQDLVLNNDTRNFLGLLHDNGVPVLLMKGTPLALLIYDRPFLRERCDSDVYIRESDVEAVGKLLSQHGYGVHNLGYRPASSKQFQASIRSTKAALSTFDIHFRVTSNILFMHCLPFDVCWAQRQPVSALGPAAWALSNIDLLLHACIHRIAHFRNAERDRLIWLYDIHLLWTAMDVAERKAFIEKALDKKIGAVCADALSVCNDLFNTLDGEQNSCGSGFSRDASIENESRLKPLPQHPPDITLNNLLKNHANEPTAPLIESGRFRWAWADFLAVEGLRAKAKFARELIFKR